MSDFGRVGEFDGINHRVFENLLCEHVKHTVALKTWLRWETSTSPEAGVKALEAMQEEWEPAFTTSATRDRDRQIRIAFEGLIEIKKRWMEKLAGE